jgi:DNA (cytosine-5)-methyltransferase 1
VAAVVNSVIESLLDVEQASTNSFSFNRTTQLSLFSTQEF